MAQLPSNSDNASEQPIQRSDKVLELVSKYHSDLVATQAYISFASKSFSKVENITSKQFTNIFGPIYRMKESIRDFYQSLKGVVEFTSSTRGIRSQLLVTLHSIDRQLNEGLIPNLTTFREISRTSSIQRVMSQRQEVLRQLELVLQDLINANTLINALNTSSLVPENEKPAADDVHKSQTDTQHPIGQSLQEDKADLTNLPASNPQGDDYYTADNTKPQADLKPLSSFKNPIDLRLAMHRSFRLPDFRILCRDLDINYPDLEGDILEEKMQSLIDYFRDRDRYEELVKMILKRRPKLTDKQNT